MSLALHRPTLWTPSRPWWHRAKDAVLAAGDFVLGDTGKRKVLSNGKFAAKNASDACDECCGGCPASVFITVADVVRCTTCMLRNTFTGGATAVDMLAVNGTFEVPFVEDQIANSVCRYFGEIDTGSNVIEITQYNDCCVTPSTPGSYNAETTIIQFDLLWSYLHNVWIFIEVSPDVGPDGAFLYGDVGGTTGVAYDEAATNERTVSDCNKPCDGFSTYSTSGYGGTAVISRNAP